MSTLTTLARLVAIIFCMGLTTTLPASAATVSDVLIEAPEHGKLQSFSKSEYYIRAGGTPPTLEALAANPKKFFRHQMAYAVFKKGFEVQLGKSLGDSALKRLLSGNKVRLVACKGSIYTTGVDKQGNVSWFTRSCAPGEQLLVLRVRNQWVVVASMGCLNLVDAPLVGPMATPVVMDGNGFTPVPPCIGKACDPVPPPPPVCTKKCEPPPPPPTCKGKACEPPPKPEKKKGNNGWGNGDQTAPGKSGPNNDAENNGNEVGDKEDPSHGGNAGGKGGSGGQGKNEEKGNGKNK